MKMNSYKMHGREVIIRFTCGRCGKTYDEPATVQLEHTEGNLQCWYPPDGWRTEELRTPMLCDECAEAFEKFLKMEE